MNQFARDTEQKLRTWLHEQGLRVGDRLPGERELAAALGMGRTALRPALDSLEALGLLERRPQSGTYLRQLPETVSVGARLALIAPFGGTPEPGRTSDPLFLHRVATAFEAIASPTGATLQLYDQSPAFADPCGVKDLTLRALTEGCQAVVLIHPIGTREKISFTLALLHDKGIPTVIVSSRTYPGLVNQVYFDSAWGMYLAARLLTAKGHTQLGFVGGPTGHEWVHERLQGFHSAITATEGPELTTWEWFPEDTSERLVLPEDGQAAFAAWLSLPLQARPSALVCANDTLALGVLAAARAAGVRVPEELALTGFDDDPGALLAGLTTLERPTEALGAAAARVALERLAAGPDSATVNHRLKPRLKERTTT